MPAPHSPSGAPATASALTTVADEGERADVVISRHVPGLSRRVARRLALAGRLSIDGRRAAPSQRVVGGQRLEIRLDEDSPSFRAELTPAGETPGSSLDPAMAEDAAVPAAPPHVLAVTERFIYVDKPAGLHTHALVPGRDALATRVGAVYPECREASDDPREGGALHRLDRDTSGVIAFARDRQAWRLGREAFSRREPRKTYVAIVHAPHWPPTPPEDALDAWLRDDAPDPGDDARWCDESVECPWARAAPPAGGTSSLLVRAPLGPGPDRRQTAVSMAGRLASTRITALRTDGARRLVVLELLTGHRHQLRVHLAWLGVPIVGDALYRGLPAQRLMLHAWSLALGSAWPTEPRVRAPLPSTLWAPTRGR